MKIKAFSWAGVVTGLLIGLGLSDRAEACSESSYYGSLCFTAADFCPRNYKPAMGKTFNITDYEAVYSLIGTHFGGDDRITFGVPDLRGRSAIGIGKRTDGSEFVTLGMQRGDEQATLDIANMPSHAHALVAGSVKVTGTLKANDTGADIDSPIDAYPAGRPSSATPNFTKTTPNEVMLTTMLSGSLKTPDNATTTSAGSGLAVPILGPRQGLTVCIRMVDGDWPNRP